MSVLDIYQFVVGEIGFPRREFLYDVRFWEVNRIVRGYNERQCQAWSIARWHAYNVMSAIPYCDLKKAGIYQPSDLLKLPSDRRGKRDQLSDDDVKELQELMSTINSKTS